MSEFARDELDAAHQSCVGHRTHVEASGRCGCFHCLAVFAPAEIEQWVDDDRTAICPRCGIDSVIPSASGWPVTEAFLAAMRQRWFGGSQGQP